MTLRRPAATLTDPELLSHLRALGDGKPTPGFGPTFPDRIRDGAHRRRTNSRIATAFLVTLVVIGVPLGLLATTRGDTRASPAAAVSTSAAPSAVASYGGVTATWLPAGVTHTVDNTVVPDPSAQPGEFRLSRRDVTTPALTIQGLRFAPGIFLSQFTGARPPATPPPTTTTPHPSSRPPAGPDLLWITVSWEPPDGTGLADLTDAMKNPFGSNQFGGRITTSTRTVNGRPAIFATIDDPGLRGWLPSEGTYNHDALLAWATPSGALLTVESATATPTDLAALQRVADGLVLGTRPPNPTTPAAPDATTATAALDAVHDAFAVGVSADRFAAAVQGGDALTATHTALLADNPQFGPAPEPPTNAVAWRIEQIDPDTVSAAFNLAYDDLHIPGDSSNPANLSHYAGNAIIVRTSTGWQVSRDTFCDTASSMGIEPDCPPA
ncbi:hypothetical protein I6A60_35340 [Frankia sp. AgB1.9]|uniref:hypothetical protein n=1 Tax=unclassified Frankia TaxID=2632575 RepID=UPI001933B31A|nr:MULTISPECIES: hypothetical protein [unclassified Frankia]MBL7492218.1 hypothetical protein [Frankia sp. AgW1.1]MBL7553087.1 hypothetical protein [Frankia sp. AgB1.9]MBL7623683.1 hypothetical protein [Frankia sp. AgB1.8]